MTDADVLGGKPRIAGTRIGVHFLARRVAETDLDADELADRHDLALGDVYLALAYYHNHPEEMREIARRRKRRADEADEWTTLTPPDE